MLSAYLGWHSPGFDSICHWQSLVLGQSKVLGATDSLVLWIGPIWNVPPIWTTSSAWLLDAWQPSQWWLPQNPHPPFSVSSWFGQGPFFSPVHGEPLGAKRGHMVAGPNDSLIDFSWFSRFLEIHDTRTCVTLSTGLRHLLFVFASLACHFALFPHYPIDKRSVHGSIVLSYLI